MITPNHWYRIRVLAVEDRRSRSFPSHTTRHAGPHLAVR